MQAPKSPLGNPVSRDRSDTIACTLSHSLEPWLFALELFLFPASPAQLLCSFNDISKDPSAESGNKDRHV